MKKPARILLIDDESNIRKMTKARLEKAGFEVADLYYMNFMGMFQWYLWGRVLKIKTQSSSEMSFMDNFVPILRWVETRIRPPMGISVMGVGRKRP